jgi:protein-L-isoaspartate(D-aspartate) O-methyltransferase
VEKRDLAAARERMVEEQLAGRDIIDRRVLDAMRAVPRDAFVPSDVEHLAYADAPLPIGFRQTISQPYIVALMVQLACLKGEETVLEVGTGSGYQAAVLARVARQVYSVEYIPELAQGARQVLERLGVKNVEVITGDGSRGLPEHAPYDAILVAAAAPRAPEPLKEQLSEGGFLVLPVGGREGQILERWRRGAERTSRERITGVAFVPLCGELGWEAADGPFGW